MYEEVLRLGLSTGLSETYWKVYLLNYNENQDTWEKGDYIYTAHSWISNLYPDDDIYLGYWYTKTSMEFKSSYYIDKQDLMGNGCAITIDEDRFLGSLVGSTISFQMKKIGLENYMVGQWIRYLGDGNWQNFYDAQLQVNNDVVNVTAVDFFGLIRDALTGDITIPGNMMVQEQVQYIINSAVGQVSDTLTFELVLSDMPVNVQTYIPSTTDYTVNKGQRLREIAEMAGGYFYTYCDVNPYDSQYYTYVRFAKYRPTAINVDLSLLKELQLDEFNVQCYRSASYGQYNTSANIPYDGRYYVYNSCWSSSAAPGVASANIQSAVITSWYAGTARLYNHLGYKFGDIITVNGKQFIIMGMQYDQSGCTLISKAKEDLVNNGK